MTQTPQGQRIINLMQAMPAPLPARVSDGAGVLPTDTPVAPYDTWGSGEIAQYINAETRAVDFRHEHERLGRIAFDATADMEPDQ